MCKRSYKQIFFRCLLLCVFCCLASNVLPVSQFALSLRYTDSHIRWVSSLPRENRGLWTFYSVCDRFHVTKDSYAYAYKKTRLYYLPLKIPETVPRKQVKVINILCFTCYSHFLAHFLIHRYLLALIYNFLYMRCANSEVAENNWVQ